MENEKIIVTIRQGKEAVIDGILHAAGTTLWILLENFVEDLMEKVKTSIAPDAPVEIPSNSRSRRADPISTSISTPTPTNPNAEI